MTDSSEHIRQILEKGALLLGNPFSRETFIRRRSAERFLRKLLGVDNQLTRPLRKLKRDGGSYSVQAGQMLYLATARLSAQQAAAARSEPAWPQLPGRLSEWLGLNFADVHCVLEATVRAERALRDIVGRSAAITRIKHDLWTACFGQSVSVALVFGRVLVARHHIALFGETGTGKELCAKVIGSGRIAQRPGTIPPMISINAAAIVPTLLGSELFGHVKGAFTGAVSQKPGRIKQAHTGTLFLDEVSELTKDAQATLLRVVQEQEVRPIGSTSSPEPVDVRYVAATNVQLDAPDSGFRPDLRQRLVGMQIDLPPLRERREDIPLIGKAFLDTIKDELEERAGLLVPTEQVLDWLQSDAVVGYDWPGNVRELHNAIRNFMLGFRTTFHGKPNSTAAQEDVVPNELLDGLWSEQQLVDWYLQRVLLKTNNNQTQAAKALRLDRNTIRKRIQRLKHEQ